MSSMTSSWWVGGMSRRWWWRERQYYKTLIHRGLTTSVLAGCDTRTLRVWCPRAAAPGSAMNKAEETPLVPQAGQWRNWSRSPTTTGHKVKWMQWRLQKSRVRSHRRVTNISREENGLANQETSTADQGQMVYKLNGLEALGNKALPRERCPRGQRRRCFAQDSAGMDGLKRKNSQGRDLRTQEWKEQPLRERADLQLVRRA